MFVIPSIPEPLSRAICADLLNHLPPPAEDTPEARAVRDQRAVTAVAHLLPENAAEAEVAVLIVAAQCHARDALRCAAAHAGADPAEVRRCRAQAASMMRQADSGLRTLLRLQAERHKAEDALRPFAMQRAGYWFYGSPRFINGLSGHNRAAPGSVLGYRKVRRTTTSRATDPARCLA